MDSWEKTTISKAQFPPPIWTGIGLEHSRASPACLPIDHVILQYHHPVIKPHIFDLPSPDFSWLKEFLASIDMVLPVAEPMKTKHGLVKSPAKLVGYPSPLI